MSISRYLLEDDEALINQPRRDPPLAHLLIGLFTDSGGRGDGRGWMWTFGPRM